jgi:hypothetical protein
MIRGRTIYHCHGEKRGQVLGRYKSHAKALKVHRAIMANKKRKRAMG